MRIGIHNPTTPDDDKNIDYDVIVHNYRMHVLVNANPQIAPNLAVMVAANRCAYQPSITEISAGMPSVDVTLWCCPQASSVSRRRAAARVRPPGLDGQV